MKPQQIAILVGLVAAGTALGVFGTNFQKNKVGRTLRACNSGDINACYKVKDKSKITNGAYFYKQRALKAENLARKCDKASELMSDFYCKSEGEEKINIKLLEKLAKIRFKIVWSFHNFSILTVYRVSI